MSLLCRPRELYSVHPWLSGRASANRERAGRTSERNVGRLYVALVARERRAVISAQTGSLTKAVGPIDRVLAADSAFVLRAFFQSCILHIGGRDLVSERWPEDSAS